MNNVGILPQVHQEGALPSTLVSLSPSTASSS